MGKCTILRKKLCSKSFFAVANQANGNLVECDLMNCMGVIKNAPRTEVNPMRKTSVFATWVL